jgi:hypothetical protein
MTEPNVIEIKLDRLIEEMRFQRSQTISIERRLREIDEFLKARVKQAEPPKPRRITGVTSHAILLVLGVIVGAAVIKVYFGV